MPGTAEAARPEDMAIYMVRRFKVGRERVFDAWTQPQHMARWFGPKDFTVPHAEADPRESGVWRVCIRSPEGQDYWMHGAYREVARPERLVFTMTWEEGHTDAGSEMVVTLRFAEDDGGTRMSFHKAFLSSRQEAASQTSGWSECFDRLDTFLANLSAGETA